MNLTAVITGGSKGIGLAVAKKLGKAGFDLLIVSRNLDNLSKAKKQLHESGVSVVHVCSADLSCKEGVMKAAQAINQIFSTITVLVNNVGVFSPGSMMEEDAEQFEMLWQSNVFSAYWMTKAMWPLMKGVNRAHVFNMCSIASVTAYAAGGSYSVAKFALLGFSKSLRLEGILHGIAVTAIMSGATLTDSWAGVDLPDSRFMKPSDVAETLYHAFSINESCVMEEVLLRPVLGDI